MIEIFSYILGFLTLIMIITAIHEAGHFYVARFFNVKILDFSIGMGRSIKNYIGKDGTSYNLRLFPVGGYVKMLGEDVMDKNSKDIDDSFASKKYFQKVLILFAGPFANFLLAVFIHNFEFDRDQQSFHLKSDTFCRKALQARQILLKAN